MKAYLMNASDIALLGIDELGVVRGSILVMVPDEFLDPIDMMYSLQDEQETGYMELFSLPACSSMGKPKRTR